MRQFNTRLFLILLGSTVALAVGLFVVHWLQTGRIAQGLLYQARRAEAQGQLDQTSRYLGHYLEFSPSDLEERSNLARVLAGVALDPAKPGSPRSRQKALFVLEQVVAQDPSRESLRRQLIEIAMLEGRIDLALTHLKVLPESAETLEMIGQCHEVEDRMAEAATHYWKAIQADPKRRDVYSRLARILNRPNTGALAVPVKSADAVFDLLVERNQDSFQAYVTRWRFRSNAVLKDPKKLEEASQDVLAAVKLAPDEADVVLIAAELAQAQAQAAARQLAAGNKDSTAERDAAFDRGREQLRKGIKLYPKDRRFYLALAHVEVTAAQPDAALAVLDQGLKVLPNQNDLLWLEANLLLDNAKDEAKLARARTVLDDLVQRKTAVVGASYLQARLALLAGQWREAAQKLESVRIALEKDQGADDLRDQVDRYLAQCYEQTDEPGLRREALDRVVRRTEKADPTSTALTASRRHLIGALIAQGRYDDAISQLTKVAEAPGAPRVAWTELARLMIARRIALNQIKGEWKDVEAVLLKALPTDLAKASPEEAIEPYMLEARMLVFQGKGKDAEERLLKLQQHFPKQLDPWLGLATLADVQNKPDKAVEMLDNAEKALGDSVELRLARAQHWSQQPKDQAAPELKKLAQDVEKFTNEDQRMQLLQGLVELQYRSGLVAEAQQLWGQLNAMAHCQNDLRVKEVYFDLALVNKDWLAIDGVLKEIQRIEGAGGPLGNYVQGLRLVRQAASEGKAPPPEARDLLDRVAAARPQWLPVKLARADLELKSGNLNEAKQRLREAMDSGESQNRRVLLAYINVLQKLGQDAEVNKEMEKLPKDAFGDGALGWLGVQVALRDQNPAAAVQRALATVPPESSNYLDYLKLGTVFALAGSNQEAEKNLRQAVKLGGQDMETWVALCQLLAADNRTADARTVMSQAEKEVAPDQKALTLGRCSEILGETEQAGKYYQAALKARPNHVPTLKAVIGFQINGGRPTEAEPLLRLVLDGKVEGSAEDRKWARHQLAVVRAAQGDFKSFTEALALVGLVYDGREGKIGETSTSTGGSDVLERRMQADVLAMRPQRLFRSKAIEFLIEIEKRGALTREDRVLLARLYEVDGTVAKARDQWQALVNARVPNPVYLNQYAQHLLRNKQYNEAQLIVTRLEDLEKTQKVPAGSFGSVELTTRLLEARGDGDKALELVRKYVQRQGSRPEEVFLLVSMLTRQKKFGEALSLCESAWNNCPAENVSGASVAVLRAVGKPTDEQIGPVEKRIQDASRKDPKSTVFLLHLADLADLKGDYAEAQTRYRQVLEKDARNYVAMNNLAWLMAQTSGNGQEALRLIGQAIEGLGERPELLDTRAMILLSQKQAREAIIDLQRANADARTDARSFRLAQAYLLLNDRTNATKTLREAQQAGLKPEQLHPIEQKAFRQLMSELAPQ